MLGYYLDLALHSLGRNRMLTALMVLAIALGIGASMTTLTVLHVLSGDPLALGFLLAGLGIALGMALAYGINLFLMLHYELPRLPG